jgi:hypothetical protein
MRRLSSSELSFDCLLGIIMENTEEVVDIVLRRRWPSGVLEMEERRDPESGAAPLLIEDGIAKKASPKPEA